MGAGLAGKTGGRFDLLAAELGLEAAGFNLAGVLSANRYDAIVPPAWRTRALLPHAASVVVLGCGGRAFGAAFLRSPEAQTPEDPVDHFAQRAVEAAVAALRGAGGNTRALYAWERRDGTFLDLILLAREAGLGAPSRLGLLLHPSYGPWLALRAVLLTEARFDPSDDARPFAPCEGCPAPCADACPGQALATNRFDVAACARTGLVTVGCRDRCDARHACVVGKDHAYDSVLETIHRAAARAALEDF